MTAGSTDLPDLQSFDTPLQVILVADDEEMVRFLVVEWMRGQGYAVLSASDGQEALELSRRYQGAIHLVVSDVDMPRLKGTVLCACLLRERPGIKALLMTGGSNNIGDEYRSLPVLCKPFDRATINEKVREVLAAPSQA